MLDIISQYSDVMVPVFSSQYLFPIQVKLNRSQIQFVLF